MPNWVENELRIKKSFLDYIVNSENKVDFGIIAPMPASLNCESGSNNYISIYYYLSNKLTIPLNAVSKMSQAVALLNNQFMSHTDGVKNAHDRLMSDIHMIKDLDALYEQGKLLVSNYAMYGAETWYEWRINNWGCKWNASNTEIYDATDDADYAVVIFSTPWSAPDKWLECLSRKGVKAECTWHEESGYNGIITCDGNGNALLTDLPFGYGDDDEDYEDDDD